MSKAKAISTTTTTKSKKAKKKRKINSFLDCQSILQVVDFPDHPHDDLPDEHDTDDIQQSQHKIVSSNVVSDITKEIFFDRLVKEIVIRFSPSRMPRKLKDKRKDEPNKPDQSNIWNQRIVMGTNQCLRILESAMATTNHDDTTNKVPILCVCARDIYPPTMLVHVPVIVKKLGIPHLILPGKGSHELGKALGVKKTSILLFLKSSSEKEEDNNNNDDDDDENKAIDSFCDYVVNLISNNNDDGKKTT